MLDYQGIINSLESDRIIELMQKLGADRYVEKDDCIIFPTICHNISASDASMKLYYYKDNKFFYCYTQCSAMSIFKFLEEYYKTREIDYDWYNDIYLVAKNCALTKSIEGFARVQYQSLKDRYRKKEQPILKEYQAGVLEIFQKTYPVEWLNDGISKEAMDKFNILYYPIQNKIIIPHYSIEDKLIGIRGRALNLDEIEKVGKYLPLQIEQTWYKHPLSLNLYGLNVNKDNIKKYKRVFVFESEKSVLQFESFKQPHCAVAVCGSAFNKYQLNLLLKYCSPKEVILCFDNEEKQNEEKYFNKLYKICQKYNNYVNMSFIYDRQNLTEKKDSPSDKGEEIFNKLIERRVKVK